MQLITARALLWLLKAIIVKQQRRHYHQATAADHLESMSACAFNVIVAFIVAPVNLINIVTFKLVLQPSIEKQQSLPHSVRLCVI